MEMSDLSKLLIDEAPLIVLPGLAHRVGLNEAIAVQQLHWLTRSHRGRVVVLDDRPWFRADLDFWKDQFPFWSESTVKRVWASLRECGLVETSRGRESNVYTINYGRLEDQIDPSSGSKRAESEVKVASTNKEGEELPEEQSVADATGDAQLFPSPAAVPAHEKNQRVWKVWCHYLETFSPARADLTPSREKLILRGLKEVGDNDDGAEYLCKAISGLKIWRRQKPGDETLSAIFATRPGGSALGDQIEFFAKQAESGGTSASPKNPSVLSGTITQKKREVVDMLAYPDSPDHKQRGLAAIEWLKDEIGQVPIIEDGELRGWRAA